MQRAIIATLIVTLLLLGVTTLFRTNLPLVEAGGSGCQSCSTSWAVGYWLKSDALAGNNWSSIKGLGGDVYTIGFSLGGTVMEVLSVLYTNSYILQLAAYTEDSPVQMYAWEGAPGNVWYSHQMGTVSISGTWFTYNIFHNSSSKWFFSYQPTSGGSAVSYSQCSLATCFGSSEAIDGNQAPLVVESYDNNSADWSNYVAFDFGLSDYFLGATTWYYSSHAYIYAYNLQSEVNYALGSGSIAISSGSYIPNWMGWSFSTGNPIQNSVYYISNTTSNPTQFAGNAGTKLY